MDTLSRRDLLYRAGALMASAPAPQLTKAARATQVNTRGFFTIDRRNGRWWLITPDGKKFFSIGLNHIDSATLRYTENAHIWRNRYGNSMKKWLEQAKSDLRNWGKLTDKPVLLADSAGGTKAHDPGGPDEHRYPDPNAYGQVMQVLRDMPQCVGFHLCGAYLANRVRRRGLRSEKDKIHSEAIEEFTKVNRQTAQWMRK